MRGIPFLLSFMISFALVYALNQSWFVGGKPIPAFGKFMSPFTGFWQNAEPKTPQLSNVKAPGLSGPVEVVYDDLMIPHIFANNMLDAAYVQGYVTASMRLWQMEFQTHAAAGRLSEIFGAGEDKRIYKFDKNQRRLGMTFAAERALAALKESPEEFAIIERYSAGVNAYIAQLSERDYPVEYKLLGYAPEAWNPYKSCLLLKYMAQTLIDRADDLGNTIALKNLGRADFDYLYPEFFEGQSPVISVPSWDFFPALISKPDSIKMPQDLISDNSKPERKQNEIFLGSNNWAVAGSKTASGKPILCNDPHLNLNLPSIWYAVQLHTPETNVYGVSIPGGPGVIIGFNEFISWGVTNVSHDVKDWYQIQWKDSTQQQYLLDGQYVPSDPRVETFKVRGWVEPQQDTIKYTVWGPVVHDDKSNPHAGMAMRWLAHDPSNDFSTFLRLDIAKSYDDYVNALSRYGAPAQNFVYADKEGNIALWVNGRFPLRYKEQGRFIQDGSDTKNNWAGFIPHAHNPHMKNPERGFVSSANQHSTDLTYPYYYTGNFEPDRGRFLNEQLAKMSGITVDDMKKLQANSTSLQARDFLRAALPLVNTASLNAEGKAIYDALAKWNHSFDADSELPAFFLNWYEEAYNQTYDEVVKHMAWPEQWQFQYMIEKDTASKFFDHKETPKVEQATDIITDAFNQTLEKIAQWKTDNKAEKITWAAYANHGVRHLIPGLGAFSYEGLLIGGHGSALNATNTRKGPSGPITAGPSWRMIVDWASGRPQAQVVYPGGQSGNPGSVHYNSMLERWSKGEYFEALFLKSADEQNNRILTRQTFSK